jgi:hypothetical protein
MGLLGGLLRSYSEYAAVGLMGLSLLATSQWLHTRQRSRTRPGGLSYGGVLKPV